MQRIVALLSAVLLASCEQAVVCNPETWCEGNDFVRCDLVCTGTGGPKSTKLPDSCERKLIRTPCAASGEQCGPFLDGPPRCFKERPSCDPATTRPSCPSSTTAQSCVLFSVQGGQSKHLLETVTCPTGKTCTTSATLGTGCQ